MKMVPLLWLLLFSFSAAAELDSSGLLLAPSDADVSSGLDSGRYNVRGISSAEENPASDGMKIRLKKVKSQLPSKKVKPVETDLDFSGVSTVVTGPASMPIIPAPTVPPTTLPKLRPAPVVISTTTTTSSTTVPSVVAKSEVQNLPTDRKVDPQFSKTSELKAESVLPTTAAEDEVPTFTEQVEGLFVGGIGSRFEEYKERIHPDDIRWNQIEIEISTGAVENKSKSSYSYRKYSTTSPFIRFGAEFWMTPLLGVYGSYTSSMGAAVPTDDATRSKAPAQHEITELGIDLRKYFGMSRKANSLKYGINFSEYKFTVPGDETNRGNLKSSGIGFHLQARVPVAPSYAMLFGGKIIPRVMHSEGSTGLALDSGSSPESSRVTLQVGGELKMSRQNQILWDLSMSYEKNQFGDSASLPDPQTGVSPKGVTVDTTMTFFTIGYRWGQ